MFTVQTVQTPPSSPKSNENLFVTVSDMLHFRPQEHNFYHYMLWSTLFSASARASKGILSYIVRYIFNSFFNLIRSNTYLLTYSMVQSPS